jgi:hypothetical protein
VPSNQTLAADEVVARFADAFGDDDKAKKKMHKCITKILDDALGDDSPKKRMEECERLFFVSFLLLISFAFSVCIVDVCFSTTITEMRWN